MFRYLQGGSIAVATALLSSQAMASADIDYASDIVVTARLEARQLRELKTPALGVGIDDEQIAAINAINAEDTVRYAPAIIVRKRYVGDANATLSFRNMHTTQTPRALVTVDGFAISNFLGADYFTAPKWAVLAPGDVASADVTYGPTSARYSGHTLGGAMRLMTRDISEPGISLNLQAFGQNYKYYQTDENLFGWSADVTADLPLTDRGGIAIGYRHFRNQGQPQEWRTVNATSAYVGQAMVDAELPFLRIGAQDSVVETTRDQLRLRGKYDLGGSWQIRGLAALMFGREDMLRPKSFLRDDDGAETFIGINGISAGATRSTEYLAGIGLSGEVSGWWLDLSFSRFEVLNSKERRSDNYDMVTGAAPLTGRLVTNDAAWNSFEGLAEREQGSHTLAFGLSYAGYSDRNETHHASDWKRAITTGLRDASGGKTRLIGVFAEDAISLTPALTATIGLRYERWRASGGMLTNGSTTVHYASRRHDGWSPKVALNLQPDRHSELSASAALATRFPTVRELYQAGLISYGANVGELDLNGFNPDLKPEKAVDIQLTAKRRIGNVKLTLSAYRQDVRDTIFSQTIAIPDADTGELVQSSLMTNIDKVRTWGTDFVVSAEDVLIEGLSFDGNLSWIDAKVTRNALNPALVGNYFPRIPKWRANASLRYSPREDWSFAVNLRHQGMTYRNIENDGTARCSTFYCVTDFSFVDLKATKRFGGFELSAGVDNLFNEKAFVYHPYPGRTFILNLKWEGQP